VAAPQPSQSTNQLSPLRRGFFFDRRVVEDSTDCGHGFSNVRNAQVVVGEPAHHVVGFSIGQPLSLGAQLPASITALWVAEPNVLRGMGLTYLSKNEEAIKELAEKGMAPG
jgi:hypothetical protein